MTSLMLDACDRIDQLALVITRSMEPHEAERVFSSRLRYLDGQDKMSFCERGIILMEVEERELWRETGHRSLNAWISDVASFSRASCFDAKEAMKRVRDVPRSELEAMPRCNVKWLGKVSPAVRRDPAVISAAQNLEEKDFVKRVNEMHPTQHLESSQRVSLNMPASARIALDEAVDAAMTIGGYQTKEDAIEAFAACWFDSMCEDENYAGLTNRQVWTAMQAQGRK